jgi:predicted DNA-binding transcriptional regulator AlpA
MSTSTDLIKLLESYLDTIASNAVDKAINMQIKKTAEPTKEPEQAISLSEAAKFCGYSVPGFRKRLTGNNPAPYHRPEGAKDFKFFKSELTDWLKGHKRKNPNRSG